MSQLQQLILVQNRVNDIGTRKLSKLQELRVLDLRGNMEAGDSSLDKVVSVTVGIADEDDFAGMNEEWLKWFPKNRPARQGAKLPTRITGLKVSIAAIAEA